MAHGEFLNTTSPQRGFVHRLAQALPQLSPSALIDISLIHGEGKKLARISCAYRDANDVRTALATLNMWACPSDAVFAPSVTDATGFVVASVAGADPATPQARAHVFVSRDQSLCELASRFAWDDGVVGELLGYPSCCVAAYRVNRPHHLTHLEPRFVGPGNRAVPFWTNTMLDVFGCHLISFFPCSAACALARAIAFRHWQTLCRLDPAFGIETGWRLRTLVLRHPALGLMYGKRMHAKGGASFRILDGSAAFLAALQVRPGQPDHDRLVHLEADAVRSDDGAHQVDAIDVFDFTGDDE